MVVFNVTAAATSGNGKATAASLSTYVNASLESTQAVTVPAHTFTSVPATPSVVSVVPSAQFSGGELLLRGAVDEVQAYSAALATASIQSLYHYDRASVACPAWQTFSTSLLQCVPLEAVARAYWRLDGAVNGSQYADEVQLLGGSPSGSAAATYVSSAASSDSSLSGSTSDLVADGDLGEAVYGRGSAYSFAYQSTADGVLCAQPACVPSHPAWLEVRNVSSALADLSSGWSISFWYQPATDGILSTHEAPLVQTQQNVISDEQPTAHLWAHRVQLVTTSTAAATSTALVASLRLSNGSLLSAELSYNLTVQNGRVTDADWHHYLVSYAVDAARDTLTATLLMDGGAAGSSVSSWSLQAVQTQLTSLNVSSPDYRWSLLGSSLPAAGSHSAVATVNQQPVHGYVDELRVLTGPVTSAQVQSLAVANQASALSTTTALVPGFSYQFIINSSATAIALNTSDEMEGQTSAVLVPPAELGVELLDNEDEGRQEVTTGQMTSLLGSITVNVLNFTFEQGRTMVGIWPGDVNLQCSVSSLDPTSNGTLEASQVPKYCLMFNGQASNLAPFYVTQDQSTALFVNVYMQLTGSADVQYNTTRVINLVLSLLNWYQADLPGGPDVNSTSSGPQGSSPSYNVAVDSKSTNGAMQATAAVLPQPTSLAGKTATYTSQAVHPKALRRVDRTHTVHYDWDALLASRPAHIRSGLQAAHLKSASSLRSGAAQMKSAAVVSSASASSAAATTSPPPTPSYCMELVSIIDNNASVNDVNPLDYLNTTVVTCYQSGVGPTFSYMSESGQLDNNNPVVPITMQPTSKDVNASANATAMAASVRSVYTAQLSSTLSSYLVSPQGQAFYLHLPVSNNGTDSHSDEITAATTVNHTASTFSLLSSAASEPLVSHANQLVSFTVTADPTSPSSLAQHCVWMLDEWGGVSQWCRSAALAEVDAAALWTTATWDMVVNPASDFQAAKLHVRSHIHPWSEFDSNGCEDVCAAGVGAVALDSMGILHVGRYNASGMWEWSPLSIASNTIPWTHFDFYTDAVRDINADGLTDDEDADNLLGIAFGGGRLARVYMRDALDEPLPGTGTAAFTASFEFATSGRGEPFPVTGPLIADSLSSYWRHVVFDYSLPTPAAQHVLQGKGSAYAIVESHKLVYTAWQPETATYSTYSPLADSAVDVLAYAVANSTGGQASEGALFVGVDGGLYCVERQVSDNAAAPATSLLDGGVTEVTGLVRCRSKKDASKPCSQGELLQHQQANVLRLEPVVDTSFDMLAAAAVPDLTSEMVWAFTGSHAVLIERRVGQPACQWEPRTQLHLSAMDHAAAQQTKLGAQGVAPVTYAAAATPSAAAAGTTSTESPTANNAANYVPPQFQDDGSLDEDPIYDKAGDGTQTAYGGAANLSATVSSVVALNGLVPARFAQQSGSQLVTSPTGAISVYSGYQAVPFSTVATFLPEPTDLLDNAGLLATLTQIASNPTAIPDSAFTQYKHILDTNGDSAVLLVYQWVFQYQKQPLSSQVLSNYNVTATVLGLITSMFPPSAYASPILLSVVQNSTLSLPVVTAALQAGISLHCPSSALVTAVNALIDINAAIDTDAGDLSGAAASAVSVWSGNTACAQTVAAAVGFTAVQQSQMASAAQFYSALSTSKQGISHPVIHRYLQQACPELSTSDNSQSSAAPCHPDSMRATLQSGLSNAVTPAQASQMLTLLGNTGHDDDVTVLINHARDETQNDDIRYAALWALRKQDLDDAVLGALTYLQQNSPSDSVRLGALRSLAVQSGRDCHHNALVGVTRELIHQFQLVNRRPLELKAMAKYFDNRLLCATSDQVMARHAAVRLRHQIQSIYAQNGPYTAMTAASHSHFVETVGNASVASGRFRPNAISSPNYPQASTPVGQANTLLFWKDNWGAENVNLQINAYGGYTFDTVGFTEEAFAATSINFYGYKFELLFGDANSYWSSGGSIGFNSQFSVAYLSIYNFAIISYDLFSRSYTFQPGVGISTGDTCALTVGYATRFSGFSTEFLSFSYFYGIPDVAEAVVGASMSGTVGVTYGAMLTLPTADAGQTVTFASFAQASVRGYVSPGASVVVTVSASLHVGPARGGVSGVLTLLDAQLPLVAGYNIQYNAFGTNAALTTNMLRGSVVAYASIDLWFYDWSDSWTLFSWPGISFSYTLYQSCYCPTACAGVGSGSQYGGSSRRRLLSLGTQPRLKAPVSSPRFLTASAVNASSASRRLLGGSNGTPADCAMEVDQDLCSDRLAAGEQSVTLCGLDNALTELTWDWAWCQNVGATNCEGTFEGWCEAWDKTGDWLDQSIPDAKVCKTRYCTVASRNNYVDSDGYVQQYATLVSANVMAPTASTLTQANANTVSGLAAGTTTSVAGASLAHRSWRLYSYLEPFVLYSGSHLNSYLINTRPLQPAHVFPLKLNLTADGFVNGGLDSDGDDSYDDDDDDQPLGSGNSSYSSSRAAGAGHRRLLATNTPLCGTLAYGRPQPGYACNENSANSPLVWFSYDCRANSDNFKGGSGYSGQAAAAWHDTSAHTAR